MPPSNLKFDIKLGKMFHSRLATQLRSNLNCSKNKQDIVAKIVFFFQIWPIQSCTMPSTHEPPPSPSQGNQNSLRQVSAHMYSVTILEDRYATYNNKLTMKQDIHEMIPVLNKVIPLRSISFKIYCCFISKTLKCLIQGSNLADS